MFTSPENDANRSSLTKVEEIHKLNIGNLEGLETWKTSNHLRTGENCLPSAYFVTISVIKDGTKKETESQKACLIRILKNYPFWGKLGGKFLLIGKERDLGTQELSGKVVLSSFEEQLFYTREMSISQTVPACQVFWEAVTGQTGQLSSPLFFYPKFVFNFSPANWLAPTLTRGPWPGCWERSYILGTNLLYS